MAYVDDFGGSARIVRANFAVAFGALAIGGLFGVIQALHRTGYLRVVSSPDYYSVLTGHGVLLALVFTTFFIAGLFTWGITKELDRDLVGYGALSWGWFWMMTAGTLLAAVAIFGGLVGGIPFNADVLYTFYPPLQADWPFYLGLALLIVGSWIAGLDFILTYRDWRSENPDERIPLRTFMVLTTMLMWYIATLGVAVEVVFFLLPWSLGIIPQVDTLLSRTLFWYFGHPVVYFWLLPAYFVWYTILPKLSGGRLFSDPLARVVFLLFLLLSTPVGFHHQYVDPGIPEGFKFLAMTNTMFLLLPSLLTAFTVVASIEHGARQRGGSGRFGWLRNLPWDEPAFAGCVLAGLMFAAGGFSGMVNAGMNLNYLVHNTIWVPGHFHLTVGTAGALTFMAITYWLLPQITGKPLRLRSIATAQPYVWFLGMTLMSNAMHREGLLGVPRRTAEPTYAEVTYEGALASIGEAQLQIAIGGTVLFVAVLMFSAVVWTTWLGSATGAINVNAAFPEPLSGPEKSPGILDDLRVWVAIAVVLVILAYGLPLWDMVADGILAPAGPPAPPA